jgi:ABC-type transport system substrate-binding protein
MNCVRRSPAFWILDPEVDRLIDRATVSVDDGERRQLYGRVQQIVAEAALYITLWYKTHVAVNQPDLEGVRLLPAADFTFLRDVHRRASEPQVH